MSAPAAVGAVLGPRTLLRIAAAGAAVLLAVVLAPVGLLVGVVAAAPTPVRADSSGPLLVGDWGSPVTGYVVTRWFGNDPAPECAICATFHNGVDLGAPCNTPIYAIGPGTVLTAGWLPEFGYTVVVDHGGGYTSWYAHQIEGGPAVAVGDQVVAGMVIGAVGTSGASTGCHVHLEIRVDGSRLDPQQFLATRGIAL